MATMIQIHVGQIAAATHATSGRRELSESSDLLHQHPIHNHDQCIAFIRGKSLVGTGRSMLI